MITFEKNRNLYSCLVCGCREISQLQTIMFNRKFLGYQDSITAFGICNDCIAEMYRDLDEEVRRRTKS